MDCIYYANMAFKKFRWGMNADTNISEAIILPFFAIFSHEWFEYYSWLAIFGFVFADDIIYQ